MAVSRRSSQHQQSSLQPSPRNAVIASPPPESPSAIIPESTSLLSPSSTGAAECGGATMESAAASSSSASSPDRPSPATAVAAAASSAAGSSSCSSISSSATAGSQSPGSGATSPGEGVCGAGGAFRELFEACRNGDVSRVKRLVDSVNVNAKDMAGRKSTPLHFAAGLYLCIYHIHCVFNNLALFCVLIKQHNVAFVVFGSIITGVLYEHEICQ